MLAHLEDEISVANENFFKLCVIEKKKDGFGRKVLLLAIWTPLNYRDNIDKPAKDFGVRKSRSKAYMLG